jgi:hypothetical protein
MTLELPLTVAVLIGACIIVACIIASAIEGQANRG